MTFRGTFEHALDAKHRLTIPARFRAALADGVVLAPSPETRPGETRCLSIWTAEAYDAFTARTLDGMNPATPRYRELNRFFSNTAFDTELDSANRVMIPGALMGYAGLTKEVTVTGSGECLEVWDRGSYARNLEDVMSRFTEHAESLGHTA